MKIFFVYFSFPPLVKSVGKSWFVPSLTFSEISSCSVWLSVIWSHSHDVIIVVIPDTCSICFNSTLDLAVRFCLAFGGHVLKLFAEKRSIKSNAFFNPGNFWPPRCQRIFYGKFAETLTFHSFFSTQLSRRHFLFSSKAHSQKSRHFQWTKKARYGGLQVGSSLMWRCRITFSTENSIIFWAKTFFLTSLSRC